MGKKTGKPVGRPPAADMNDPKVVAEVETCGKLGCTNEEMARVFGCHLDTIEAYMRDEESEFFRIYWLNYSEINKSLRRKQIAKAMTGSDKMLIWMGKQRLNQADKKEITGKDGKDLGAGLVEQAEKSIASILKQLAETKAGGV